ncbi:uncharacterized protein [Miscanthus floridulus]|uniref:uncharacterized protein n=1 Tax=Miscanthus floridulus TaxID=154761 RepID=UPI0034592DBB
MESQPEKWRYGVSVVDQPKLWPLLERLERLHSRGLLAAVVVATFHRRRVLPLMARWQCLFDMTPDEPIEGVQMSVVALSNKEILWMRDVRASPPPIPEDAERRAVNRAHAVVQKKRKDSEEASDDDESEVGRGTLDHLPDVRGTAPGALVSGPAFPGGGGEDALGPAIARPGAEADAPEAWALGKRAVSPMSSTAEVEQVTAGAMQPPPQRVEGAPDSSEGRPAPADTGAVPLPPPPPFRKCQAEVPALAPRKALKVSTGSTAQWVAEAQATIQRGVASARADPKELTAQGEVTEAAMKRAGEEAPSSREVEARESDEAEAPSVAEATEGEAEASKTSKAEATEAGVSTTTVAEVAEAGAPETTVAEVAEAGMVAAEPTAQEAKTEAGQALVPPLVQDPSPSQGGAREAEVHLISSDDTS